ncbi:PD-(D/E)XK nuclease superfamily protein [compost metagenome]
MSAPAHSARQHALLGASKASQWINCPPSARLTEHIPDKRSEYADEGTAAHELSELRLERRLTICDSKRRLELDKKIEAFKESNSYYGPEMENAVSEYCDFVEERFMAAKARSSDAVIQLEALADFSEWVPDGRGIGDVVIISDGILEVIDLKYGKGVPVSAYGNPQIRLYGLGAWAEYNIFYDIREIHMTIVQPRLDSITTDEMTVDELLNWAEIVVKPAAALADAGEGEFQAGYHCRWCKVKGSCRARSDANMAAVAYEFQDPALLSLDEIGAILAIAEQLQSWAKDVQTYAFDQAKSGQYVPGWKLVEGRSNRTIADKDAAWKVLEAHTLEQDKYLKPKELLGIGELEKRIGKKELALLIGDLIIKPQGKPVLVVETDRRPGINSVENDFAEVEFDG